MPRGHVLAEQSPSLIRGVGLVFERSRRVISKHWTYVNPQSLQPLGESGVIATLRMSKLRHELVDWPKVLV